MAECLNCLGNPGPCTCGNVKYDDPAPKQISRDDVESLADALKSQEQCDEDGVMCIVSRQAADEAAAMLRSLMDRVEELERELEGLGKGRH